jgi:hypothetical protein
MKTLEARESARERERESLERGPGRGRGPDEAQKLVRTTWFAQLVHYLFFN